MNNNFKEDIAVFFDYENIALSLRNIPGEKMKLSALYKKCEEYGRLVLANAYADWSIYNDWLAPLKASGFNPVHVPSFTYEGKNGKKNHKNAVDIQLSIEIVDVMHTQPHIRTFILITGDKDFVPIVDLVRKYGKRAVALGVEETTSAHLIQAADEFISYTSISETPEDSDIFKTLAEVVEDLYHKEKNTVFPRVKDALEEKIPDFDKRNYTDKNGKPFERFKEFILAADALGYVRYQKIGTTHQVFPPDVSREIPIPTIMALDDAYELLMKAINSVQESGRPTRATSIKNKMLDLHPGFDEKEIQNKNGKFFSNFSHFARSAKDSGLIEVKGVGFDMMLHQKEKETAEPQTEAASSVEMEQPAIIAPERALIIDAIRTYQQPTPAYVFGQQCQNLRSERNIDLPNRRINQLLSEAKKYGIVIQEADSKFVFINDSKKIDKFLTAG